MTMSREQKTSMIADHFGAILSYADAIDMMARSLSDQRTSCAFQMVIDGILQAVIDAQNLFDELLEGDNG